MNWRNTSRSSTSISRNAIHLDGGGANVRIGLICTALPVIFFIFQVRSISSYSYPPIYTFLGSTIAVECIFSSSRDTISIQHASLQPETIHMLMVLKHHLCQMHEGDTIILE